MQKKTVFISYRSIERHKVITLAEHIEELGYDVWFDKNLTGGQSWWEQILTQIRQADIVVLALSQASIESVPCVRERQYAQDLNKLILPVLITDNVNFNLLPASISTLQVVNHVNPNKQAVLSLGRALSNLPAPTPLPDPLPSAPEIPISPLTEIREELEKDTLSRQKQTELISTLENMLSDTAIKNDVVQLMQILRQHPMIDTQIATRLDRYIRQNEPKKTNNLVLYGSILVMLLVIIGIWQIAPNFLGTNIATPETTPEVDPPPEVDPTSPDPLIAAIDRAWNFTGTENNVWQPYTHVFDERYTMALVPVGCFMLGSTATINEQPVEEKCIDEPFWIDVTEVTNAEYGCETQTNDASQERYPATCIDWQRALEHCQMRNAYLPSEVQWEYVARGVDGLLYPWGNAWIPSNTNHGDLQDDVYGGLDGFPREAPVGSFPDGVSWVGALDMAGNVMEWTLSKIDDYPYDASDGREDTTDIESARVLRGGSFFDTSDLLRTSRRYWDRPIIPSATYGFRCAMPIADN